MKIKALLISGIFLFAGFAVAAQTAAETGATAAQGSSVTARAEAAIWDTVIAAPTEIALELFLQQFPDGVHAEEAKTRLAAIRDAAAGTVADSAAVDALPEQDVSYSVPLISPEPHIDGRSIERLAKGTPLFPPIEGLPEEIWKDQSCAACHQWEKANLCDQGNFYAGDNGKSNLTKQHPYGGGFKQSLLTWAVGGCQ